MCAGIPRSGSTWLYNAARLLIGQTHGVNNVYGTWVDQYNVDHGSAWHVVKIHDADDRLANRASCVMTSRRDLRDIAASAWKRNWINDAASALAFLDRVVAQHAYWQPRAAHEMVYESMRRDQRSEVAAIARTLALGLDDGAIDATLHAIESLAHDEASTEDFDPSNLMHKKHIMDGRVGYHADTLPTDVLATINDRYDTWLRACGYVR